MFCPFCHVSDTKVIDSRVVDDKKSVRRRRECLECGRRFTTYEMIDEVAFLVVKKDGRRERFDRTKIVNGLIRAFEKRQYTADSVALLAEKVEQEALNSINGEITSHDIGEIILANLQQVDKVAYVRFASVYKQFETVADFVAIVKSLELPQIFAANEEE